MIAWNFQRIVGTCQFRVPWFGYPCGYSSLTLSILEADANVVLTRQNCRVNTVGNLSMTIYNKHVLERARHESEGAGALQYEIVKEIIYYE